jgi:ABC-type sugar transport system permease subunit
VEFNQAAALSVMFFGVVMLIVLAYIKVFASQPGGEQ